MTSFTQKQQLNIHNFKNFEEFMKFDEEIQILKDQGYFDDAEEQQPLNLSLFQTIMGLGVREKVISSCPHQPCFKELKDTLDELGCDGEFSIRPGDIKILNINELRDNEVVEGVENWYMKECYTDPDNGMLMDIEEEDYITNEIYCSKVFKWHINNGLSFDEFCEDLENIIMSLWEEEEERCHELNLPDPGECTYYIIWKKAYDWLINRGDSSDVTALGGPTEEIAIYFMGTSTHDDD